MNETIKGAIIGSILTFIFTVAIPNLWIYFNSGPSLSVPEQSFIISSNKTIQIPITNEGNKAANNVFIQGMIDGKWTNASYILQIKGGNTQIIESIPLREKIINGNTSYSGNIGCYGKAEVTFSAGDGITEVRQPIYLPNIVNNSCYQIINSTDYNSSALLTGDIASDISPSLLMRVYCKDCSPQYHSTFIENHLTAEGNFETAFCKLRLCNYTTCYNSECISQDSKYLINLKYFELIPFSNV